jgi:hypothetical protein
MMTLIQTPGVKWVVSLLQLKLGYVCHIFISRVPSQGTNLCSSSEFHVDDRSESSSTYDMIIDNQRISP